MCILEKKVRFLTNKIETRSTENLQAFDPDPNSMHGAM